MIKGDILLFCLYIILYKFKNQNLVNIIKKLFKKDLDKDIQVGIVRNGRI
jgi:hypothetical protein